MVLPGGIVRGGQRLRDYSFRSLTGVQEIAVAEAFGSGAPVPQRITAVLAATLDSLGGEAVTEDAVRGLAIGDRLFLMQRLVVHLGMESGWFSADCEHCSEPFDFPLRFSDLPCKPGGEGFPFAALQTEQGNLRLRAPAGADQEILAAEDLDGRPALLRLVGLCLVEGPADFDMERLSDDELAEIDRALEAVSPEPATEVALDCPACSRPTRAQLDVTLMPFPSRDLLFQEVHRIASVYHWSEADILSLGRDRRQRYLAMIARDQASGVAARRLA